MPHSCVGMAGRLHVSPAAHCCVVFMCVFWPTKLNSSNLRALTSTKHLVQSAAVSFFSVSTDTGTFPAHMRSYCPACHVSIGWSSSFLPCGAHISYRVLCCAVCCAAAAAVRLWQEQMLKSRQLVLAQQAKSAVQQANKAQREVRDCCV